MVGCGKRHVTRSAILFTPQCEIVPSPGIYADTVAVAVFDPIDLEYAPWARNEGERRLFGHLYETLITVDCTGDVQAGLAASWDRSVDGRRWTFEVQKSARFWDGSPVTAGDVAWSWRNAPIDPGTPGAVFDSVASDGERTLHVYLKRPHWEVPRAFSALTFAVAKSSPDLDWLLGSGPYAIAQSQQGPSVNHGSAIVVHPAFGARGPVVRFVETSTSDARDLLTGTVDVMITGDPAVIEYASHQPHLDTVALPWNKTYVLLSTSRVRELLWGGTTGNVSPELTDGLARDAVRIDARGSRSPFWWEALENCGEVSDAVSKLPPFPRGAYSSGGSRRILFDLHDPIARDLAERIVALAATDTAISREAMAITSAVPDLAGGSTRVIAEGVPTHEFRSSLRDGDDFAYVVAVLREPPDRCDEAARLLNRAQWLAALGADFSKAPVPLVDTRQHVIAKREKTGLISDWYGNLLIVNGMLQKR